MAKVKIKGLRAFTKKLKKKAAKIAQEALIKESTSIENEIIITILSGKSPVKGKRFKQYSPSYARLKKGGSRKPVTMMDKGDMLDSLSLKEKGQGVIFEFGSVIATFHDKLGAGASRVIRRLLPRKGEEFKSNIARVIRRAVKKAFKS